MPLPRPFPSPMRYEAPPAPKPAFLGDLDEYDPSGYENIPEWEWRLECWAYRVFGGLSRFLFQPRVIDRITLAVIAAAIGLILSLVARYYFTPVDHFFAGVIGGAS